MKNRLQHVPDERFERFIAFARANPGIVSVHHLLQKLAIYDFVAPFVEERGSQDVLEIGCGIGIHSALLSHAGRVCATELVVPGSFVGAGDGVAQARDRVFSHLARGTISFEHNDGHSLPYPDASFDLVFHNSVVEHVPNVHAFLRETWRVLRPGGMSLCITGTPVLCWQRFLLGSVLKLPWNLTLALAREVVPARWLVPLARALLSAVGTDASRLAKAEQRLRSVSARALELCPQSDISSLPPVEERLRNTYPRLRHFLDAPAYNRMVFDEIARELRLEPGQLGSALCRDFESSAWSRVLFELAPRTHGQHYRDWRDERAAWRVECWVDQMTRAGFQMDTLVPFRFHHIFESTPLGRWDAHAYYWGLPLIRAAVGRGIVKSSWASEILFAARKPTARSETVGGL